MNIHASSDGTEINTLNDFSTVSRTKYANILKYIIKEVLEKGHINISREKKRNEFAVSIFITYKL